MKKYILGRILRSLISIFLVTAIVYTLIYALIPRRSIFVGDPNYTKMAAKPDSKENYQNQIYDRMGYIEYLNTKSLLNKVEKIDSSVTGTDSAANTAIMEKWEKEVGKGWDVKQFPTSKEYYAVREIPMWERLLNFFGNLIQIDHINKVQDKTNPNLKRGYSISTENGFAIVGSGTQYKYQLYFNGKFPFIHQNAIRLNLGESYPTYKGYPVMDVITQGQGQTKLGEVNFPKSGKTQSAVNIYSAQYASPSTADKMTQNKYGDDPYTKTTNNMQDPSMVGNSMLIGILSVIVTYLIGVPLAIMFARNKGKWLDNAGIGMIMILIAVPSLAFIYIFRFIGSALFGLPDLFTTFGAGDVRSYILPTLILAGLSIPGIIQWTRRYMIDQSSSDYVKFARAKGLTEKEISRKHIMKNAMIPIAQGIPGAIILTIAGATMTETIFNVPGMGKMLPDALKAHNNAMVVGLTFIFTTLAVLAVLAGDILMTLIDPRIKLSSSKGDN